jgi:hypothetical protein
VLDTHDKFSQHIVYYTIQWEQTLLLFKKQTVLLFKKNWEKDPIFFFVFQRRNNGMAKTETCSVANEEVLQVERKWPFLPITTTYDQYVQ